MQDTENFELPVTYSGEELLLPASFGTWGYSHRITMDLNGVIVYFEPDEERNYRALLAEAGQSSKVDAGLLQAIVEALERNFKS